jgi:hypothetical protein
MVFKEELADGWGYRSGANNVKHGEVRGIWVRASMPLPSGELVVRDYCLPDSLPNSRTWAAKSVHVGLNK